MVDQSSLRERKDALEYYRGFAIGFENRSQSTIRFKETPIRQLILYLGGDFLLQDIQEQHIIEFLEWLRQRSKNEYHPSGNKAEGKVSDITINTYFRGLRAFFNWLVKRVTTGDYRNSWQLLLINLTRLPEQQARSQVGSKRGVLPYPF